MIVLDTTVLVYAVGVDHPLAAPCRSLIQAIGDGEVRATTSVGVLQEFAHVRARRRDRGDAATLTTAYAELLRPLLEVSEDDLHVGLQTWQAHPTIGAFDAVLLAQATRARAALLVTADRAFDQAGDGGGVEIVDPAMPDLLVRARQDRGR